MIPAETGGTAIRDIGRPDTMPRTRESVLWVLVIVFAAHVIEEYRMHWVEWATTALGLNVDAPAFFVVNASAMCMAIAAAMVGWRLPEIGLSLPATLLTNAIFFHILPTIAQRRLSPGTITAVVLYLNYAHDKRSGCGPHSVDVIQS